MIYGVGALRTSDRPRGHKGMYGHCHCRGNINCKIKKNY
jgi:hypothetical protein